MTPKQILDSFSETLIQDERILSVRERSLVLSALQHARSASNGSPENGTAVSAIIAAAIGEVVAQRAFAVLGANIVERIIEGTQVQNSDSTDFGASSIYAKRPLDQPEPPHVKAPPKPPEPKRHPHSPTRDGPMPPPPPQPEPPHVKVPPRPPQPEPPHGPRPPHTTPAKDMPPPSSQPEPPHATLPEHREPKRVIATMERPETTNAQCLVLDEFLAPQELEELTRYTLEHEQDFFSSEVVSPSHEEGIINYEHRRSMVLEKLGRFQDLMLERIKLVLPQVLSKLGVEEFSIADVEAQITASNDGDFFRAHCDDGDARVARRQLTFVYFFHREPRQFEGGELRIYDPRPDEDHYKGGDYQTIVPQQNQIVFFPCSLLHEITPVECPSRLFADSRFTLNGWLHN
jgi:SM-20-related protein